MTEVHVTRAGLGASSGAVDTNPVTTEIVRHSLNSAANQMERALVRTAFRRDLREGYITEAHARRHYAHALAPDELRTAAE